VINISVFTAPHGGRVCCRLFRVSYLREIAKGVTRLIAYIILTIWDNIETFARSLEIHPEEWACEFVMFLRELCSLWQHNARHYSESDKHKDSTREYDFKPLPNRQKDIKAWTPQSYSHKSQAVQICRPHELVNSSK